MRSRLDDLSVLFSIEVARFLFEEMDKKDGQGASVKDSDLLGFYIMVNKPAVVHELLKRPEVNSFVQMDQDDIEGIFDQACEVGMEDVAVHLLRGSKHLQDNFHDLFSDGTFIDHLKKHQMGDLFREIMNLPIMQDEQPITRFDRFEGAIDFGIHQLAKDLYDEEMRQEIQEKNIAGKLFLKACENEDEYLAKVLLTDFEDTVYDYLFAKNSRISELFEALKGDRMHAVTYAFLQSPRFRTSMELGRDEAIFEAAVDFSDNRIAFEYYGQDKDYIKNNPGRHFKRACKKNNEELALRLLQDFPQQSLEALKRDDMKLLEKILPNRMENLMIKLVDRQDFVTSYEELGERFDRFEWLDGACEGKMPQLAAHLFDRDHIISAPIEKNNEILVNACKNKMEDIVIKMIEIPYVRENIPDDFMAMCLENSLLHAARQLQAPGVYCQSLRDVVENIENAEDVPVKVA